MLSLNNSDRDEFLYLQRNLMLFTNQKFNIYPIFKTIDDFNQLDDDDFTEGLFPIREKMYDADNIDAFCNHHDALSDNQISTAKSWCYVYADDFYVIKHLKSETILLTKDEEKLYGVIGILNGMDVFFPNQVLPTMIRAKLLPFKGKIIYDGYFSYHKVHFGRNISGRLNKTYKKIKGAEGIIINPEPGIYLVSQNARKDVGEIIRFYVKESLKENRFPNNAWQLAEKDNVNRQVFEHEFAKYFAKRHLSSLKLQSEIKAMYYAMYRDCIIGVSTTKKLAKDFCEQHYPVIANYVYIFKA